MMAWIVALLEQVFVPLLERWIQKTAVAKQLKDIQSQQAQLTEAVGQLQAAQTPQEIQDAIKAVAAADNLHSQ